MSLYPTPNLSGQLFAQAISQQFRLGARLYDQSVALLNDPEAYDTMLNSGVIRQCFERRTMLAAGLDWDVEAGDDSEKDKLVAKVTQRIIGKTRQFRIAREHLAKAIVHGTAFGKCEWAPSFLPLGDGVYRQWMVPRKVRGIDRRMIRGIPSSVAGKGNRAGTSNIEWEVFSVPDSRWFRIDEADKANYVRHAFADSPDRLGHGNGLINAVYFLWYFRNAIIAEWLRGAEFWSRGFIEVAIKASADGNRISDDLVTEYQESLERQTSEHIFVHGADDIVKLTQGGGEGANICRDFVTHIENEIRTLINHSVDNVASSEGGSYARADTHADSEQMVAQADRSDLAETLTISLVERAFDLNYANFRELGCAAASPGKFSILDKQVNDPEKTARTFDVVLKSGAPIPKKHFYESVGIPMPAPGEDVVEAIKPAAPSFGMPGGFDASGVDRVRVGQGEDNR